MLSYNGYNILSPQQLFQRWTSFGDWKVDSFHDYGDSVGKEGVGGIMWQPPYGLEKQPS